MKKLLLILIISSSLGMQAQEKFALVINGGKFEFGVETFVDRATFGFIDYYTQEYIVADTIEVESVQKIASTLPNDGTIFIAAQDSILAYQYNATRRNFDKLDQISFPNIKTITANQEYLVAGKWYGAGDYLVIYEAGSLNEVFTSQTIKTEVKDLLIFQDTLLAVSYNLQGKIDNCAPYGCYTDSIGKIDIIDLNKLETIKSIDLGARGKGNISLVAGVSDWTRLIAVSSENELITAINKDFEIELDTIGTGITASISEDSQYNNFSFYGVTNTDSLSTIMFNIEEKRFEIQKPEIKILSKAVWTSETVLMIDTDYDSYGAIFGIENEAVAVGISPEDIFVGYFGPLGIWGNSNENTTHSEVIYADDLNELELEDVHLYSSDGKIVMIENNSENIHPISLTRGIYVLKAYKNNSLFIAKVIKD